MLANAVMDALCQRKGLGSKTKNNRLTLQNSIFGIISVVIFFVEISFRELGIYIEKNNICRRNHLTQRQFSLKSKSSIQHPKKEVITFSQNGTIAIPSPKFLKTASKATHDKSITMCSDFFIQILQWRTTQ